MAKRLVTDYEVWELIAMHSRRILDYTARHTEHGKEGAPRDAERIENRALRIQILANSISKNGEIE